MSDNLYYFRYKQKMYLGFPWGSKLRKKKNIEKGDH